MTSGTFTPRISDFASGLRRSMRSTAERAVSFFDQQRIELVTVMSALLLFTHSPHLHIDFVTPLTFAALVVPRLRHFGPFWIGIAIYRFWSQVPDHWPTLDNHQYLITWWLLGLGLTLMAREREDSIRRVARLLIGLCFLFATVWKIRSPDFLDGDFFTWKFATDTRLRSFAEAFLGLPEGAQTENLNAEYLLGLGQIGTTEELITGSHLRTAAIITAWYTVLIEGAIAVFYLVPERFRVSRWAHWALAVFIITVYPIAPVFGFALLLLTMSIAALRRNGVYFALATLLFAVMPLFSYFDKAFDSIG